MYFAGIDIGTQGARVLVIDSEGNLVADQEEPFRHDAVDSGLGPGYFEQSPESWWDALTRCLDKVAADMERAGSGANGGKASKPLSRIHALSVTSTSGTIIPIDSQGRVLRNAIMYNDSRAGLEAQQIEAVGGEISKKLGYRFNSSYGLAKILWIKRNEPEIFDRTHLFIHATDYIIGRLTGESGITDYSNALKSGYDLIEDAWPSFIEAGLEIPFSKLPKVVAPGKIVGDPVKEVCLRFGLDPKTVVAAGATDGCASQFSTGAVSPGDWSTTIGTTLVIKGVSDRLLKDPQGRIYSHKHPEGYWLPGGASNTGGECLEVKFGRDKLKELDTRVLDESPSGLVVYPLVREGERFPFVNKEARGFVLGSTSGEPHQGLRLYASYLEGVGYLEKLAYQMLAGLGARIGPRICVSGGAARSLPWLQIRADILQKTMVKPRIASGAMGAAILAASKTAHNGISEACRSLIKIECLVEPRPDKNGLYHDSYGKFVGALQERGYIR